MQSLPPAGCSAFVAFLAAGCVQGPGAADDLPAASFQTYVDQVEPILASRCGLASCHGTAERPLGLFVVPHHRREGASGSITNEELVANYDRARSFLVDGGDPEDAPLLAEPLAVSEGGVHHAPGPVFSSAVDHEYQAILAWAEEALEDSP